MMFRLLLKSLLVVLTLQLSGCIIYLVPEEATLPLGTKTVQVTRVVVEDVDKTCQRLGLYVPKGQVSMGCATWNSTLTKCTMYVGQHTTHRIKGHELHHCFEGHFHE
jgi:hypothetical protein